MVQTVPWGQLELPSRVNKRSWEGNKRLKGRNFSWLYFVVVELPSCVQLFATPWTATYQASLSLTSSQSLPKIMSNKSVMPSNHLSSSVTIFSFCLQFFPSSGSFPMSQPFIHQIRSVAQSFIHSSPQILY